MGKDFWVFFPLVVVCVCVCVCVCMYVCVCYGERNSIGGNGCMGVEVYP